MSKETKIVLLDPTSSEALRALGLGNLSAGVRMASTLFGSTPGALYVRRKPGGRLAATWCGVAGNLQGPDAAGLVRFFPLICGDVETLPAGDVDEAFRSAWPSVRPSRHMITIEGSDVVTLRTLGAGNLSAGIRRAALRLLASGFVP